MSHTHCVYVALVSMCIPQLSELSELSELSDSAIAVGAVGAVRVVMTDYDMGVSCKLSEFTVGLSDGTCQTVGGTPVGAVIMSDLCRISVVDVCRTVGPGLNYKRLRIMNISLISITYITFYHYMCAYQYQR